MERSAGALMLSPLDFNRPYLKRTAGGDRLAALAARVLLAGRFRSLRRRCQAKSVFHVETYTVGVYFYFLGGATMGPFS
jgi:hypothetical protein